MNQSFDLPAEIRSSPLYGEDLAPIPPEERTWSTWNLAAIWIGMAVCIPTYLLASYMITAGLSWVAALVIITLANLIITVPMVLNGHAGVEYGIPFPVVGRSSFGTRGIHVASIVRALVACGWFGIQTWIGGLAFYEIYRALFFAGVPTPTGLVPGKFVGFALFWLLNIYFIWKGAESIKWLETFAAPILVGIGLILIGWGAMQGGGVANVLEKSAQLQDPTASLVKSESDLMLHLQLLEGRDGAPKASEYRLSLSDQEPGPWLPVTDEWIPITRDISTMNALLDGERTASVRVRAPVDGGGFVESSDVTASTGAPGGNKWWLYLFWLTGMVGFWATMSLSISDITRYARSQKEQIAGQFLGLPGAMMLYSFVGIFVTAAAVVIFPDVLVSEDAPWDPVSLLGKFENPLAVVVAQVFMIIATLSTNIAANVIAPANAFANLMPQRISFRWGGIIAGVIGIIICPWWLLDEISGFLILVSGLLGPILGIMLCDYFVIRKKRLRLAELYRTEGLYAFGGSGVNMRAMIALGAGVASALVGLFVPSLSFLYTMAWFTGFAVSFVIYYAAMRGAEV